MTARQRLEAILAPEVVALVESFIDERVAAAVAVRANGDGSPWLSLQAAANYLGVSARTLERVVANGRLCSFTVGRRRLVHRDELNAYARAAGEE